jgi:hypothetical protein
MSNTQNVLQQAAENVYVRLISGSPAFFFTAASAAEVKLGAREFFSSLQKFPLP